MSLYDDDDPRCVVIDNGSGMLKAGFAGDDEPRVVFPPIVGRPRIHNYITSGDKSLYIGDETTQQRLHNVLSLSYPIQHGTVTNWEDMESIWEYMYTSQLRIRPEEWPAVLAEASLTPASQRERTAQVFFESFNVPSFYMIPSGILAVYASGRGICLACESGDGVTQILPIYEGMIIRQAVRRSDFGGRELTHFMSRLLYEAGYSLTTQAEIEIARDIKEKTCYVAEDYEVEMAKILTGRSQEKAYKLPNGSEISLGKERVQCAEAIFKPDIAGISQPGLHKLIFDSLMECDIDTRKDLFGNVLLFGGNTMFQGIGDRLRRELATMLPPTMRIKVITQPERKCSVWIGGSILASLSTFYSDKRLISKQEYDEFGPYIVNRRR